MIDIAFDFRSDTPPGKDPDALSPTLRRYHKLLWSKPLPTGVVFELTDTTPSVYLHHRSQLGEFWLASDTVLPTFTGWKSMQGIIRQLPEEDSEAFRAIIYTIGGMMIFPGNRIHGKQTLNGARGFTHTIADRFDLTLECIRLYYQSETSPLFDALTRYRDFFSLFGTFRGYVEFFLLHDLVTSEFDHVKFFMHCDNFTTTPVPQTVDDYVNYRQHTVEFVKARNHRIECVSRDIGPAHRP